MQDQNEDTEWNDVLRAKGIIPQKEKEITEDEIVNMIENTITEKQAREKQLEDRDLDELEDSEDEAVILEYRKKRIAEMRALADKSNFGIVKEISGQDYVTEVNKAGSDIWVVLHLYKQGIPHCAVLNQHIRALASKFPTTKFLKSISATCIPNFPDKNLPTIFIYFEGDMKQQFVGSEQIRGQNITQDELEYMLGKAGAVKSEIKDDPRPMIKDKMLSDLHETNDW